jgi:hypothetical protein
MENAERRLSSPRIRGLATHVVFALLHLLPSNQDSYSLPKNKNRPERQCFSFLPLLLNHHCCARRIRSSWKPRIWNVFGEASDDLGLDY